jgi:hypothetical protein
MSTLNSSNIRQIVSRWPSEVAAAFLVLDASKPEADGMERRKTPHTRYNVRATLELSHGGGNIIIYSRDLNPYAVGFMTNVPLALGKRGTLHIYGPGNVPCRVECDVYRCREFIPGWFEAAAHFRGKQIEFGEYNIH